MSVKVVQVVNDNGVPFNVRFVEKGERYGLDSCLLHEEEDGLVEFYDARYTEGFTVLGQFVSRYYVSTLLNRPIRGLNLEGGSPNWYVTDDNMDVVYGYLATR